MRAKFLFPTNRKEARMSIGLKKIEPPVTPVEFRTWLTDQGIWYVTEHLKDQQSKRAIGISYRMRLNANEKFAVKMRWL